MAAPPSCRFDDVLQEVQLRLSNAYHAALGTLEAELQHMRRDNARLRAQILEAEAAATTSKASAHTDPVSAVHTTAPSIGVASGTPVASAAAFGTSEVSVPIPTENSIVDCTTARDAGPQVSAPAPNRRGKSGTSSRLSPQPIQLRSQSSDVEGQTDDGLPDDAFGQPYPIAAAAAAASVAVTIVAPLPPAPSAEEIRSDAAGAAVAVVCGDAAAVEVVGLPLSAAVAALGVPPPPEPDMRRALEAVLANFGWQHLSVQRLKGDAWSFAGVGLLVRHDSTAESPQSRGLAGSPHRLVASDDNGRSWEPLETLIRRRRLFKVVRAVPIATGVREYCPEPLLDLQEVEPEEELGAGRLPSGPQPGAMPPVAVPQVSGAAVGGSGGGANAPNRRAAEASCGAHGIHIAHGCHGTIRPPAQRPVGPLSLAELAASVPQGAPLALGGSVGASHHGSGRLWMR